MIVLRKLIRRVRSLVLRSRVERDLADELRAHIELEAEARVRQGIPPERARREAAVVFGARDAVAEACRDVRGVGRLDDLMRDMRLAARSLWRSPAFALTAIAVLALGVGAATAVFSIAEGVLFRPLPYASPDRLYSAYEVSEQGAIRGASYPTVRDWEAGTRGLMSFVYIRGETLGARIADGAGLLLAGYASDGFFEIMGAAPALGRVWDADEERSGARVAVLTHDLWRESFGGDPGIVGRSIPTDSGPVVVLGVMPEGFRYPAWSDLWLPLRSLPAGAMHAIERRDLHVDSRVLVRLADGTTPAAAAASLGAVNRRVAEEHAEARGWSDVRLDGVQAELFGDARTRVLILGAAVLLLLLISCANVGSLLIARGATRGRELATRVALGATRARVVQQLLVEAFAVAACGALAGAALASAAVRVVVVSAPDALPRLDGATVDARALGFAVLVSALAALLFGTLPALRAAGIAPVELLRSGRGAVGARRGDRLRAALVAAEVALATVLVVGAALLVRTVATLGRVELGLDPAGVAAVQIVPPSPRYDAADAALTLYERLEEAAARVPGVRSVALVNHLPLTGGSMPTEVRTARVVGPEERPLALYRSVSAAYFATLGIAIVRGRSFRPDETRRSAPVALVNETLATREWGEADPVGKTITVRKAAQDRSDFGEEVALTVVGVASDTRSFGPAMPPPPAVYVPIPIAVWSHMYVVVKTDGDDAMRVIPDLRGALLEVDASLPLAGPGFVHRLQPMERYVDRGLGEQRLNAAVLGTFATVAFVLAAIGVFGIVAYLAVQRRREFGLRMSLGAQPRDVLRLVVSGGLRVVLLGTLLGLAAAAFMTRLLRGVLFGVAPGDVRSFALAAGLFILAGIIASVIPAARAARLQPADVLRED